MRWTVRLWRQYLNQLRVAPNEYHFTSSSKVAPCCLRRYNQKTGHFDIGDQEHNYAFAPNYSFPFHQNEAVEKFNKLPLIGPKTLSRQRIPPKRVKMLTRHFIEDSLYNPHYGYFSKQVNIFTPKTHFQFNNFKNTFQFQRELSRQYAELEEELAGTTDSARQIWHTPTELFKPYYGEAIARYLLVNYKLTMYPYHDLIIYEIGGGNGTLLRNVLDYIRESDPDVYNRTRYRVIEISPFLTERQSLSLGSHEGRLEIINKSIFDWTTQVLEPCYVLALEVFDNLPHDLVRYNPVTGQPYQGMVMIDEIGDFHEFYNPTLEPVLSEYLSIRKNIVRFPFHHPLNIMPFLRRLWARVPFSKNLTVPEYIPTQLYLMFQILRDYFPQHRLLASDFSYLPEAIPGIHAPVVQTRYNGQMVQQGYFDILFPTDFEAAEAIYSHICGKRAKVCTQKEFLTQFADTDITQTRNGENPMINWYENANVLLA